MNRFRYVVSGLRAFAMVASLGLVVVSTSAQPEHHDEPAHHRRDGDDATVSHRFAAAEEWAAHFEDPARDEWQKPGEVIRLLVDRDDLLIADIGSATGYFPVRFAAAAPRGAVFGADVEPAMVQYLNDRARREGIANLVSVLAAYDDPHLPRLVDVVFICNTYHHIDDRVDYFTRLRDQIGTRGRLAVVDFKPDSSMGPAHKLPASQVEAELVEAGFVLTANHDVLPEQYFLVFTKR